MRIQNEENLKLLVLEDETEIDTVICSVIIGLFLSGIVYIAIFIPLILHSTKQIGVDPLDILLFAKSPPALGDVFFNNIFPQWSDPKARPLVYAAGNLYGVLGLVCTFMIICLRTKGIIIFIITSNGLCLGYILTLFISENILGIIEFDWFTKKMFHFRIAYIMLTYYMFEFLKSLFNKKGLYRKKYDILMDGMFGIICAFIIINGLVTVQISILTGPIFLICLFVATFVTEQIFGRFIFGFIELIKTSDDCNLSDPTEFIKKSLLKLWENMKHYKGQDIDLTFLPVQSVKVCTAIKQNIRMVSKMSFVVFAINSIFPVFASIIYHYVLEGKF